MSVQPVTLEGRDVRLEPLSLAHHADLCEAGLDEELWRWIPGQGDDGSPNENLWLPGVSGRVRRLCELRPWSTVLQPILP
jgi:hypothetical protein